MAIYLKNIKFPVYPLSNSITITKEEFTIIINTPSKEYVLDDRRKPGNSLGARRLHIDPKILYPLKRSITDIGNFLLYTKLYKNFVDSSGKVFKYESKTKVPLVYRQIIDKIPYKGGTMLFIEKTHCPIWYYRPIDSGKDYVALLCIENGYVLLGTTDKPSERKAYKV